MAGPAYEVTASVTDDESFGFTLELKAPDGSSPIWADYTFEYELTGCGSTTLRLDETNGITIDEGEDTVTIDPGATYRLRRGQYRHGFRMTHTPSGKTTQIFDGPVTATEGNFT